MKKIRIFLILLIFIIISAQANNSVFPAENQTSTATSVSPEALKVLPSIIYTASEKQIITSGATHEHISYFTNDGWLDINLLRIDLSNENIKIGTISNPESLQNTGTIKSLAEAAKAVAAINGGFYIWTNEAGKVNPIGTILKDGQLVSTSADINKDSLSMATIALDKSAGVFLEYWKTSISVIAPNGATAAAGRYNKPFYGYSDLTILDRKWNIKSIGNDTPTGGSDVTEMIVTDSVVSEIRTGQPSVIIPENGYIIVSRKEGALFLQQNFAPGDKVILDIKTAPDWNNKEFAITGGAILIKDGTILQTFSHNIAGRNPRTAIGSSKDGKEILMLTVDGRQEGSIGLTQAELAALMLELGAYNALNLDGGGSTTMVERDAGTLNLQVANRPSDGYSRKVPNGIGIFSLAPASELAGLIIDTEDSNIFVNTTRSFSVRGYDKYFNPVVVKPESVKWSVSGVDGTFTGSTLKLKSTGEGKVKAAVGAVSTTSPVSSLSKPTRLLPGKSLIKLRIGESVNIFSNNATSSITIEGVNKNGYHAKISATDIKWSYTGITKDVNVGELKDGKFIARAAGTGYIEADVSGTKVYCAVSVAASVSLIIDDFEKLNAEFKGYPETVKGSYSLTNSIFHSGKQSGKLVYDFTDIEGTRAAYMVYPNGGLELGKASSSASSISTGRIIDKISVWFYNTRENSCWLRAEIIDANGVKNLVDFSKTLDWVGWKYIEADIGNLVQPLKLTKIYIVQPNPISEAGEIYIDDLTVISNGHPEVLPGQVPANTKPIDEAQKSVTFTKKTGSFRMSVFGQSRKTANPLERLLLLRFSDKINKYLDHAVFTGKGPSETSGYIEKPLYEALPGKGYSSVDIEGNSRLLLLDTKAGGLRATDKNQWHWLIEQLDSFQGKNIFIVMPDSPQNFNDEGEARVFQDIMTSYKQKTKRNVWVFYKGIVNESYMERGIKYLSTAGIEAAGITPENTDTASYILVVMQDGQLTFQIRPVL